MPACSYIGVQLMDFFASSEGDVHDGMQRFDSSSAGHAGFRGRVALVSESSWQPGICTLGQQGSGA